MKNWISRSKWRKEQKKIKKQKIDVVFNYSNVDLCEDMINLLNCGLNFAILPLNLDLTQVLVDFKRFERSMIWKEFWFGREDLDEKKKPAILNQ